MRKMQSRRFGWRPWVWVLLAVTGGCVAAAWSVSASPPLLPGSSASSGDPAACAACHGEAVAEFRATRHAAALQKVEEVPGAKPGCLTCHFDHLSGEGVDERRPPVCEDCHVVQNDVMLGQSPPASGVPKMPGIFGKKDCNGCHMPVMGGQRYHTFSVRLPDGRDYACGIAGCHAGQGAKYTQLAEGWRAATGKLLAEVKSLLDAKKVKSANEAYQAALASYRMVAEDRSQGAHNFPFVQRLLEAAKAKLAAL